MPKQARTIYHWVPKYESKRGIERMGKGIWARALCKGTGQRHWTMALGKGTGAIALGGLWAPNTKKSLPIFILVWRGLIKT